MNDDIERAKHTIRQQQLITAAAVTLFEDKDLNKTIAIIVKGLSPRPKPGEKKAAQEACRDLLLRLGDLRQAVKSSNPLRLVPSERKDT